MQHSPKLSISAKRHQCSSTKRPHHFIVVCLLFKQEFFTFPLIDPYSLLLNKSQRHQQHDGHRKNSTASTSSSITITQKFDDFPYDTAFNQNFALIVDTEFKVKHWNQIEMYNNNSVPRYGLQFWINCYVVSWYCKCCIKSLYEYWKFVNF